MNIIAINGSTSNPSRTGSVLDAISGAVGRALDVDVDRIDLSQAAPVLFRALRSDGLDAQGRNIVQRIEAADVLLVGSPVYRASYTGALKHLFDLVDYRALTGTVVALAATGGTALHGLMIDHQLRPLFAFFNSLVVPTTVYATTTDFTAHRLINPEIVARIDRIAAEIRALASPRMPIAARAQAGAAHQTTFQRETLT